MTVALFASKPDLVASTNAMEAGHHVILSPEERDWIAEHPVLRVGVLTNWAPFSYLRPDGKLKGIDLDILNLISQRTGLKFELKPQESWEGLVANREQLDLACSSIRTPLREQYADFTQTYITSPLVIVEREGEETFGPGAVLGKRKVALPRRYYITQILMRDLPSGSVILAASPEECFKLVVKRKADASVANLFVTSHYLNSHPRVKLSISGVISDRSEGTRIAVRRGLGGVGILNKGLASISTKEMDAILAKNLIFELEALGRVGLVRRRAEQALIVGGIAGLLILTWNYFMRREIRARRKAEAELREANESLRTFSHSLSHDLRAPLRGITGFAQVLKNDQYEKLDRNGQVYLERIITSGSRMDKIIADTLVYSGVGSSEWPMQTVELDPLVHQLVEGFPPEQRQCFQIVSKLPAVRGHATLLAQCLGNLLSNAISYVPSERRPQVVIRAVQEDSKVMVIVEDNGIGVEAKDQKRIFKIFERAAPAEYKGTGIGLAVVAKATERMGGRVGVESEVNRGSRFWVELCVASRQKAAPQARRAHPVWRRFARACRLETP
jgi:signal transduction histidine kinase